jgi:hypothetical protein
MIGSQHKVVIARSISDEAIQLVSFQESWMLRFTRNNGFEILRASNTY